MGDLVLVEVAKRLLEGSRDGDVVGRLGGDEFIAFVSNTRSREVIESIASLFLSRLREPYIIGGHEIRTSPSVGLIQFPDDGGDIDTLIQCADAAMKHAKHAGRNQYEFFSTAIIKNGARVFILEQEFSLHCMKVYFNLLINPS